MVLVSVSSRNDYLKKFVLFWYFSKTKTSFKARTLAIPLKVGLVLGLGD